MRITFVEFLYTIVGNCAFIHSGYCNYSTNNIRVEECRSFRDVSLFVSLQRYK